MGQGGHSVGIIQVAGVQHSFALVVRGASVVHERPSSMPLHALPQPFQLWHNAPATLALGVGMLAPLAFTTLSGRRYAGL